MDKLKDITDTIRTNVQLMVDSPHDVIVECFSTDRGASIRIKVAQTDIGKIIGKQGRTARSLRIILSAIGMKVRRRYSLDIVEG